MTLSLSKLIGRGRSIADDFDRTIISFETPYRLKDLCPPVEGEVGAL